MPNVWIIIVNWNGLEDTQECLASLRQDHYGDKHILIIDNGSSDNSATALCGAYPEVEVIQAGTNLGFTGGNNLGIRHALAAGADYVYLLNNDTTSEPHALEALVAAAEAYPEYGLVTPVIHYYDHPEEAWFAGSQLDLSRGTAVHDNSHVPARDATPIEIPWASGCAMLIRAEWLRRLQGFDDRYYLNWEDVDFCLRLRALGKTVGLVPAARVYHKVGRSFAKSNTGRYYHIRNQLLLVSQYAGRRARWTAGGVIAERLLESVLDRNRVRSDLGQSLPLIWRAVSDHWHGHYGCCSSEADPQQAQIFQLFVS